MPQAVPFIGGFVTALTGGAIAFGAPTAAFAAGVAAAGFATSTVGQLVITGALIVGSNLLRGKSAIDAVGANTPEQRGSVRQATPPQRVLYGEGRIGGALYYHNDSVAPYLSWGLLHSARPISRVNAVRVGDTVVAFDAEGNILTPPWLDEEGNPRLAWSFRDGSPGQDLDPLAEYFSADILGNPLPETFRQRGTAASFFLAEFGKDRPDAEPPLTASEDFDRMWGLGTQIPNILLDAEGCPIHDPRRPTSDPDDPETWVYSNNASLVQADWLRQPYGGRQPTSRIRWDEVAKAADYDDELVGLADGGYQKRYTIDALFDLSQSPAEVAELLMTANRGFVASDQGRLWVTSSRPQEEVLTLTDADFRGGFVYQETKRKDAIYNTMRTRFVAPDREYAVIDGPVRVDAALLAADGEELAETLGLPYTLTHQRAQRIADLAVKSSRLQKAITTQIPTRRVLALRAGQVVRVETVHVPRMSGLYQVEAIGFTEDYTLRPVTLSQYDGTLPGTWLPEDEKPFEVLEEAA